LGVMHLNWDGSEENVALAEKRAKTPIKQNHAGLKKIKIGEVTRNARKRKNSLRAVRQGGTEKKGKRPFIVYDKKRGKCTRKSDETGIIQRK